jgi:uncharacterized SAM-binding protein YcdF (DUF218 family)
MPKWVAKTAVASGLLVLVSFIPVRLTIAFHQAPQPDAVLVLGGGTGREEAAAQLASYYPALEVWVSSGDGTPEAVYAIFEAENVSSQRIHPDYRAVDTVTNFTTLVADFQNRNIQHVFLVTSDFHMPRAKAIATVVLGSRGIAFTPVSVPSDRPPETTLRIARDIGRSLLWIATGRTGASLGERIWPEALSRSLGQE